MQFDNITISYTSASHLSGHAVCKKYIIDLRNLTWVDFKIFKIRILTQYKYKQMYVKKIQNKYQQNNEMRCCIP